MHQSCATLQWLCSRLSAETEGEEADGTMGVEQGRRRLLELLDTMT
jgi:hypothetical protein